MYPPAHPAVPSPPHPNHATPPQWGEALDASAHPANAPQQQRRQGARPWWQALQPLFQLLTGRGFHSVGPLRRPIGLSQLTTDELMDGLIDDQADGDGASMPKRVDRPSRPGIMAPSERFGSDGQEPSPFPTAIQPGSLFMGAAAMPLHAAEGALDKAFERPFETTMDPPRHQ